MKKILIFDVDGVITDPKTKQVDYPEILEIIASRLENDLTVAFNTGRSYKWMNERIILPLKNHMVDFSSLINLIIVCEMGNVVVKHDQLGKPSKKIKNENVIPSLLRQAISDIVSEIYNESMFIDKTKEVILTIEMIRKK